VSRFDYVAYDPIAVDKQRAAKHYSQLLESCIMSNLPKGRARSLALTKLEEVYMWIGKAIRDDQVARKGSAPLQEERKDG